MGGTSLVFKKKDQ